MKFINTLREGEQVRETYLVKTKGSAFTKGGKEYYSVTLQDKSGTIDAKIWQPDDQGIRDFEVNDFVHVFGEIISYNNILQMSIKNLEVEAPDNCDAKDYLPVSEKNIDAMYKEMLDLITTLKNDYLKELLNSFFLDEAFAKKFREHSAAKSIHHGFIGGLLEHTLSVTKICDFMTTLQPTINRDVLLTAAMFHDIGKLEEISDFPTNDYTDEGQLVGHIVIGAMKISAACEQIDGFPIKLKNELVHCILSHHGELEYGSPKKPALIEALTLAYADNIDAKVETMKEFLEKPELANGDWSTYNKLFDTNLRKTSK